MESSTIIPNVTIRAANVTVFNSIPKAWNSPSEINIVTGIVEAATNATRKGRSNITTIMTAITAITSSCRKLSTLSLTTWLWSVIRKIPTSSGSSFWNSSSTLLMCSPICTTFCFFFISTESRRHLRPLLVI